MNSDIIELVNSLSDENITIICDNYDNYDNHNSHSTMVTFIHNNKNYKICILGDDTNLHISLYVDNSKNDKNKNSSMINNNMLYQLVSKEKFTNINQIFDVILYIRELLPNITSYCIGCYEKLGFQSEEYITCGKKECDYKIEELQVGNPVIDKIKDDKNMVRFLIESAIDAITCERKYDIFEPFPTYFLTDKDNVDIKRGDISKLSGNNYDHKKDFNKLNNIISNFKIDNFFDLADTCYDDTELIKYIGVDCYQLIRFIIMSSKIELVKDDNLLKVKNNDLYVYRIVHQDDKEKEFKALSNNKCIYLFHGSRWCNWYSILRNGLKNCSNTKLMTAGAAFGNGIYLSSDFAYSFNYGLSNYGVNNYTKGSRSIVGVFEVAGDGEQYKKSASGIYVVDNEKMLIQRYLIMIPSSQLNSVKSNINTLFRTTINKEKANITTTIMTKGIKKLVREYKRLKSLKDTYGFTIDVDPNNMYLWYVYIFGYDKNEPIGKDMQRFGIDTIKIEVKFPENYPFSPPFLRVITPRFQHLTGHVTAAGALCMQILTEKHWDPACSMESLIISIKSEILEGGGRLDPVNYNLPYSEKEAVDSFNRVSRGHGWM